MAALSFAAATLLLAVQSSPSTLAPPLIGQGEQPVPGASPDRQEKLPRSTPRDLVAVEGGDAGVAISGISFTGVEAPESVAAAARPYLGRPASKETLSSLAQAISAAYAKSGIALYTVAIPEQDLSTGQVKVVMAEGFVEDIVYPKGASPLIRAYAERLRAERPLTRRALERYLSLMRDMAGVKVDVSLLRGAKAGGVRLSITPKREYSDFSFGIDNRTQSGLGTGQLRATAQFNSLLRDGDRTDLTLLSAIDLKRYRYVGLSQQTPIGSDGLMLGLSGSHLDTRLKGFPITGEAWTLGLTVSYPLIRSYRRNLTVSAGLDGLNSDAALLGSVLSSDHIRTLRAAIGYSSIGDKSVLSAAFSASHGLDILDARGTPGFTDPTFTKLTGRIGYDRMIGKRFVGRVRATGQYSRDRLSGNERLAIGGPEYGRAFETAILSGDRGAAGSLELAWRPVTGKALKDSEVYGFIDGARIRVLERLGIPRTDYDLASAGGGVRLVYNPHASLTLEGARVIDSAYPAAGDGWRFNIGWHVKLRR
ncbi:Hemolysin activation/secretion protein precursor [Sphingomonas paucimobilis]|nr:Hemolysin activation/secretion protein precursor [Sphingomonas paucimobilis]